MSIFGTNINQKYYFIFTVKFAAIDIGSNGARLLISRMLVKSSPETGFQDQISFKDVEYTRFALELGKDVFSKKKIGEKKKNQLLKLMQAFRLLMELHEVDDYMALATSAFREASNGEEMVNFIEKNAQIKIEIIDGAQEAEILNFAIRKYLLQDRNYLHIDVGGGSTELNLYIRQRKIAARSFQIGSIRNTEDKENLTTFHDIQNWVTQHIQQFTPNQEIIAIGTGGNINKVLKMIRKESASHLISIAEIQEIQQYLSGFSFMDKINILQLNPDRADTIEPALKIYRSVMEWSGSKQMFVPEVGLKDGMIEIMYQRSIVKNKTTSKFKTSI